MVFRTTLFIFSILTLTIDVIPETIQDTSSELQHLLKWMESAHFPDARRDDFLKLSWVEDKKAIVAYGFKVTDCVGTTLIFTDDGRLIDPSMFPAKLQVKVSPYNFDARAAQVAESIDAYIETNASSYCWDSYEIQEFASSVNLHTPVRDALMARWCIQLGLNDTSSVLWKRAVMNLPELVKSNSIVEQFQAHWAQAVTYRGVAALSNPQISYKHVMSRIDWVLSNCPESPLLDDARQLKSSLEEAVAADEKIAATNGRSKLDYEELVELLLHQRCESKDPRKEFVPVTLNGLRSPYSLLRDAGSASLPSLDKARDSKLPTRCIFKTRGIYPPVQWATVGQLAELLTNEIQSAQRQEPQNDK